MQKTQLKPPESLGKFLENNGINWLTQEYVFDILFLLIKQSEEIYEKNFMLSFNPCISI